MPAAVLSPDIGLCHCSTDIYRFFLTNQMRHLHSDPGSLDFVSLVVQPNIIIRARKIACFKKENVIHFEKQTVRTWNLH